MDDALRRGIEALEAGQDDPRRGLPDDVFLFVSRIVPLVNVDLLIQDDRSRTLLTWRDDEFFGPGWHVPGGRGYFVSLLFRCRLLSPPDDARQAASDPPAPGQWRWHMRCPPDLLEAQRPYARFF